ncbi:carboxypeptidase-like regulatory domain-containing protein [Aquimarina gracilis]|uniref:Carboxypeptidase-like regulatory domain-containing protein n=1 Tax=Aquimarina gracilis TaxID=874422 RepID=A0ABU5ZYP3_9FLAO|nr:carboxypeptidase-like regulatory domain-containing protein [Aquimarina gracilis]MEB3347014.1 carboxypeptidase-like regulatory domain-containing protein [Aquimarina gracilis]
MKKVTVLFTCVLLLVSCKSKENNNQENNTLLKSEELKTIRGTVVDKKGKKIAYAAVKLYLDDDDCMNAYTNDDGYFEFKLDELRIKDQSHFEVVFKGYAITLLSLRNFVDNKPIILSKKGEVVSTADYHVFYESIKSCGRKKSS